MDIIFISLVIISIIFVILVIFQIFWIRTKLKNYEQTNLAAKMTKEVQLFSAHKTSNLNVYSLVLKCQETMKLNNRGTSEYDLLVRYAKPKKFNVPHVCGNHITSAHLSCVDVCFLCTETLESASYLLQDIRKGSLMYVMILGKYYLIAYDEALIKELQYDHKLYENTYVFFLYAIKSEKNYLLDVMEDCSLELTPFFGELSIQNLYSELKLNNSDTTKQMHVMGYLKI